MTELSERIAKVLIENDVTANADMGYGIHSWRCNGRACTCFDELVTELAGAAVVELPEYAKLLRRVAALSKVLDTILTINYDAIGDIPERAEAEQLLSRKES